MSTRLKRQRKKAEEAWRDRQADVTREDLRAILRLKGYEIPEGDSLSVSFRGGGLLRVRWQSPEERYGKGST